jgi:HEAT repeat protein
MEEEKSPVTPKPVITRSMAEEASACGTCGVEEPEKPAVLPDASWSTEQLIEALKDKNFLVRSSAVMLLGSRDITQVIEPLIQMLKDKEYIVKTNAMMVISGFGQQIFDRMIQALQDPDGDIRAGAAWILGELRDARAIEPLELAAKDDYPLARIQSKASLIALGRGSKKETGGTEMIEDLKKE